MRCTFLCVVFTYRCDVVKPWSWSYLWKAWSTNGRAGNVVSHSVDVGSNFPQNGLLDIKLARKQKYFTFYTWDEMLWPDLLGTYDEIVCACVHICQYIYIYIYIYMGWIYIHTYACIFWLVHQETTCNTNVIPRHEMCRGSARVYIHTYIYTFICIWLV